MTNIKQFTLFANDVDYSKKRDKVDKLFSRLATIKDELNKYLYFNPDDRLCIQNPQTIFMVLSPFLSSLEQEELWVLNLDSRNNVRKFVQVYKGTVNSSQIRIAEVYRQAIIDNSPAIVVVHNHPSGDPHPSPDDVKITKVIAEAGKLLDIDMLDHLIIAGDQFTSIRERGLLN